MAAFFMPIFDLISFIYNLYMKRKTKKDFINECIKVHGEKYDYSLVEYLNNNIRVKIICTFHGIFEQLPTIHLSGSGCTSCSKNKKMNNQTFIIKAKEKHGEKYDYNLIDYTNSKAKIKIICPVHGVFEQLPSNHLYRSHGCPNCRKNKQLTSQDFIEKSKKYHGEKYDYSLVEYINCESIVKIICPFHGIFEQRAYNHSTGIGCPHCNESKGEKEIEKYLIKKNLKFIRQKKFKNCVDKRQLPFDFYLKELNTCIEYNGIQHYENIKYWGNNNLIYTQKHDAIKENFCLNNNIKLIKIKYDENIIDKLNGNL